MDEVRGNQPALERLIDQELPEGALAPPSRQCGPACALAPEALMNTDAVAGRQASSMARSTCSTSVAITQAFEMAALLVAFRPPPPALLNC